MRHTPTTFTAVLAFLAALCPHPAPRAQTAPPSPPWCTPDDPSLSERPSWKGIETCAPWVPNYEDPMENFNITATLTLVSTLLERAAQKVVDLTTGPDIPPDTVGYCVCPCPNQAWLDLEAWLQSLGTQLKSALLPVLQALVDNHFATLHGALSDLLHDTAFYRETLAQGFTGDTQAFADGLCRILYATCTNAGCTPAPTCPLTGTASLDWSDLQTGATDVLSGTGFAAYEAFTTCLSLDPAAILSMTPQQLADLGTAKLRKWATQLLTEGCANGASLDKLLDDLRSVRDYLRDHDPMELADPEVWRAYVDSEAPAILQQIVDDLKQKLLGDILDQFRATRDQILAAPFLAAMDAVCLAGAACPVLNGQQLANSDRGALIDAIRTKAKNELGRTSFDLLDNYQCHPGSLLPPGGTLSTIPGCDLAAELIDACGSTQPSTISAAATCIANWAWNQVQPALQARIDAQLAFLEALLSCDDADTDPQKHCSTLCNNAPSAEWCVCDANGTCKSRFQKGLEPLKALLDNAKHGFEAAGGLWKKLQYVKNNVGPFLKSGADVVAAFLSTDGPILLDAAWASVKAEVDSMREQADTLLASFDPTNPNNGTTIQQLGDFIANRGGVRIREALEEIRTLRDLLRERVSCVASGVAGNGSNAACTDFLEDTLREVATNALTTLLARKGIDLDKVIAAIENAKNVYQCIRQQLTNPQELLSRIEAHIQQGAQQLLDCEQKAFDAAKAHLQQWCIAQVGPFLPPNAPAGSAASLCSTSPGGALHDVLATFESSLKQQIDVVAADLRQSIAAFRQTTDSLDVLLQNLFNAAWAGIKQALIQTGIPGCFGLTTHAQCSVTAPDKFCNATTATTILNGTIELPFFAPKDVFKDIKKDPKKALKFAIKSTRAIDKLWCKLNEVTGLGLAGPSCASASDDQGGIAQQVLQFAGKVTGAIQRIKEKLEEIQNYINQFATGHHIGGYNDLRANLQYCVPLAGTPTTYPILQSKPFGKNLHITFGSSFLAGRLSKKLRATYRYGGAALEVQGSGPKITLPFAGNVGFMAQLDGFRLWDACCLFGTSFCPGSNALCPAGGTPGMTPSEFQSKYDVFHLLEEGELANIMGANNLTLMSFLYKPAYPFSYGLDSDGDGIFECTADGPWWERPGSTVDPKVRPTAAIGAGINYGLSFELPRQDLASVMIVPGVYVNPWFQMSFGVDWIYKSNYVLDELFDKIAKNIEDGLIQKSDLRRDAYAMQAPDYSEDALITPWVAPKLGLDVVIGVDIAKFLRIGGWASAALSVQVAPTFGGGLIDAHAPIVDALAHTKPTEGTCEPRWEDAEVLYCSNEKIRPPGFKCNGDYCSDITGGVGPHSVKFWQCDDSESNECVTHGICRNKDTNAIELVDVTESECIDATVGTCSVDVPSAPLNSGATVALFDLNQASNVSDLALWAAVPDWFDKQAAYATALAAQWHTAADCSAHALCIGAAALPETNAGQAIPPGWEDWPWSDPVWGDADQIYPVVVLGTGTVDAQGNCDCSGVAQTIDLSPTQTITLPTQCVPFTWTPPQVNHTRIWVPYTCVKEARPKLTGWQGDGCSAFDNGFPSACSCSVEASPQDADNNCASGESCDAGICRVDDGTGTLVDLPRCHCDPSDPNAPPCPAGRTCVDGACVKPCQGDADCGPNRKCDNGACVVPDVPFGEQIAWRTRNVTEPKFAAASYTMAFLRIGLKVYLNFSVGLRIKLLRKWREKTLLNKNIEIPIPPFDIAEGARLGLIAKYQDDCDLSLGDVSFHLIDKGGSPPGTRWSGPNPNDSRPPLQQLVDWCLPWAQDSAELESPPIDTEQQVDEMFSDDQGLGGLLNFGRDLGIEFLKNYPVCIEGQPFNQWIEDVNAGVIDVWSRVSCKYYHPGDAPPDPNDPSAPDNGIPVGAQSPADLLQEVLPLSGCLGPTPDLSAPRGDAMAHLWDVLAQLRDLSQQGCFKVGGYADAYFPLVGSRPGLDAGNVFSYIDYDAEGDAPLVTFDSLTPGVRALMDKHNWKALFCGRKKKVSKARALLQELPAAVNACVAEVLDNRSEAIVCKMDAPDAEICPDIQPACEPLPQPEGLCLLPPGDVNGDGQVNVLDTQCTLLANDLLTGQGANLPACLPGAERRRADLNCTGTVDVVDALVQAHLVLSLPLPYGIDSDQDGCADACQAKLLCGNCVEDPGEDCASCPHDMIHGECTDAPEPQVPCCDPQTMTCSVSYVTDCSNQGGVPLLQESSCGAAPDYCQARIPAACCVEGTCHLLAPIDCSSIAGAQVVGGSSCANVQCP